MNYIAAQPHGLIVHALAIIESAEQELQVGDNGHALGLLQQHPDFFAQWYKPVEGDTWTNAYIRAAGKYLSYAIPRVGLQGAIEAYNLGWTSYRRGYRNLPYYNKWFEVYVKLGGTTAMYRTPISLEMRFIAWMEDKLCRRIT